MKIRRSYVATGALALLASLPSAQRPRAADMEVLVEPAVFVEGETSHVWLLARTLAHAGPDPVVTWRQVAGPAVPIRALTPQIAVATVAGLDVGRVADLVFEVRAYDRGVSAMGFGIARVLPDRASEAECSYLGFVPTMTGRDLSGPEPSAPRIVEPPQPTGVHVAPSGPKFPQYPRRRPTPPVEAMTLEALTPAPPVGFRPASEPRGPMTPAPRVEEGPEVTGVHVVPSGPKFPQHPRRRPVPPVEELMSAPPFAGGGWDPRGMAPEPRVEPGPTVKVKGVLVKPLRPHPLAPEPRVPNRPR